MAQTEPIEVRPATPGDAEAIYAAHVASIRVLCARDYTPEQIEAWAGPKQPENYRRAMAEGQSLFVALVGGRVVGFSAARAGKIVGLYVHPDHVGRGAGSALLLAAERAAAEGGAAAIDVNATLNAERFYAARGYETVARMARPMGGVDVPCVAMRKPLSRPPEPPRSPPL